jgi:uridine kinase
MIVEGILILANPELRDLFDIKVLFMLIRMNDYED